MDETFDELADRAYARSTGADGQVWIAVAGAPGSGKTTLCALVAERLMAKGVTTSVVPMDGFHYYRRELDMMPDPTLAHAKRGAHWTFNAERLVSTLKSIRKEGSGLVPVRPCPPRNIPLLLQYSFPLVLPGLSLCNRSVRPRTLAHACQLTDSLQWRANQSFDHAHGDPIEDAISVDAATRVVLVEGNYLLLFGTPPWDQLKPLFDERWFVSCDEAILRFTPFRPLFSGLLIRNLAEG